MASEAEEAQRPAGEASDAERRRRDAALALIRKLGDPVLKTRALPVSRFDAELRRQVDWMRGVMDGALGVGLAATQVGVVERVLVYRVQEDSPIVAVINPQIEWRGSELESAEEGCLSIPGIHVDVERNVHVRVGAVDETGAPFTIEASGLEARVLQHEIDHLDGVLMLDRTSRDQKREAMRAWRERQQGE
ncbi:MAG TPA: peptide deformylase [Solirubrobacteraceae bacterium]|nr:peptide deformylase [Solirubrobacteraceae bacterium]